MTPEIALIVIIAYFAFLMIPAYISGKNANEASFYTGNRKSHWLLVAIGMVGASLSGITFISVPGLVVKGGMSYMQVAFGYILGYFAIVYILMPLYYKTRMVSIYEFLKDRFGNEAHKLGSFYFLLSKLLGAGLRFYLAALVMHEFVFTHWNIPFWVSALLALSLIWIYTYKAGIKTIVITDTLQTIFMVVSLLLTIYVLYQNVNWEGNGLWSGVMDNSFSQIFHFENWKAKNYFWKQFAGGAFIAFCMTGLDQDMMQKNLSIHSLKKAQKNMLLYSNALVVISFLFLFLGAMLLMYYQQNAIEVPKRGDQLFANLAMSGKLGFTTAILFIVGLIAAAYSSADGALTSLTTSFCVDFLNVDIENKPDKKLRLKVHLMMTFVLFIIIVLAFYLADSSVVMLVLGLAAYTYGPLLGLFSFGLLTKYKIKKFGVALACIIAPLLSYWLNLKQFGGYQFSLEILALNGLITFIILWLLREGKNPEKDSEILDQSL